MKKKPGRDPVSKEEWMRQLTVARAQVGVMEKRCGVKE
ncbi:hypothetical protein JOD21_001862 [Jeotgalibacillus terrae]|nr:hypothetical protein [Jeotgalibacillus terrae]